MKRYSGLLRLGALVIVAPLFVWRLAIAPTFELWREYRHDAVEIAALERNHIPKQAPVPSETAPEMIQSGLLLERLMPILARSGTVVEKYTPYITSDQPETAIHTAEITMRGSYIPLIGTISFMEKELPSCRITSVMFRSSKQQNKETILRVTIIIEQLIIKDV